MVWTGIFIFLLIVWAVVGSVWLALNDTLERGYGFPSYTRDAGMWCAHNCLWIPTVLTIIAIAIGILCLLGDVWGDQAREKEFQEKMKRQEEQRRLGDMNSTEFESAVRKRLKEWDDSR